MNLQEAFEIIAKPLKLDPARLVEFAAEDEIGGYHHDPSIRKWETGSLWHVEGQFLYALVRALKIENALEIGCFRGCSSTHILAAMEKNGAGRLSSIDILSGAGSDIPQELRHRWKFINAEAAAYIEAEKPVVDFIFEDALHDPWGTTNILRSITKGIWPQPKLLISHDAEHDLVGPDVRMAWKKVFLDDPKTLLISPSDCGFAWKTWK